jgi:hypothetical protein
MKVVAFIEPPQGAVIEKILRHCGLWQPVTPRPPPAADLPTEIGSSSSRPMGRNCAFLMRKPRRYTVSQFRDTSND